MGFNVSQSRQLQSDSFDIEMVATSIAKVQKRNGEIPWTEGDKTDPWDHVEAAMGLCVAGHYEKTRMAFEWLSDIQLDDGSFYAEYLDGKPSVLRRDANMSTYIAVGLFHYYLITRDTAFVERMWDTMEAAIEFGISLQRDTGEIMWAIMPDGKIDQMALLTGSSSIYMSFKCALAIADILKKSRPGWITAMENLENAIRHRPHLFNMTKSRYSMDWFYPVLSGALTGDAAEKRIEQYWKKFVIEGQGVRCVSDRPWVTIAETSEFCLALAAMGKTGLSEIIFNWIIDKHYEDGAYWCGYTFPDMEIWPEEKTSWTDGVVLMAADSLYELTPAGRMFDHKFWQERKKTFA